MQSRAVRYIAVRVGTVRARYAPAWPVLSWGLYALGAALVLAVMTGVIDYGGREWSMGDGMAWYHADTPYDWSDRPPGVAEYRYSPAFLWLTEPLRWLPAEAYRVTWVGLHLAAVAWLGPWTMVLAFDDVIVGNINTFLAVGVVLAVRGQAWTWAGALLTKVTPGVGVLYYVGRREWRAVAMALGTTLAVVAVGGLAAPSVWADWLRSLSQGQATYDNVWAASLWLRLPLAALLCLAAARWVWLLPVGMIVAMPGLWPASFALLAAIPRLRRDPSTADRAGAS